MKVLLVAGARPNFMKIAPIVREAKRRALSECLIVHTGQHYDFEMSQSFFIDLGIPEPDYFLNIGSGSHSEQTGKTMVAFENVCGREKPDLVMVVGDVNSTLACSIVAKKMGIAVAHVEAGLRSFDMGMPEEINRIVTDALSDYFFVTEESGAFNLGNEGKSAGRIHVVGHVMVDNLFHQLELLEEQGSGDFTVSSLKNGYREYGFLTLHRPSNVDCAETFTGIVAALNEIAAELPLFFPVHPRTRKMMEQFGIELHPAIHCLPPLGFRESLYLWKDAAVVLTDSGGLQEETTALGVPCLTIRENTERPVTVTVGSNILAGTGRESILAAYMRSRGRDRQEFRVPPMWDGQAAARIWDVLDNQQPLQTEVSSVMVCNG